jgi:RimJ/RimL family protein N-acetyltransferase
VNKNFRKKTDYEFSIFLKSSGEIIGGMGLLHVDKTNRNAEVGYWLAKKYWGQGLAKEALQMVLSFGFRRLRLRKIYARVMQPNKRSCKLLESVGFKFEGRLKQQMKDRFSKNRWFDEMRFGLLSD